MAIALRLAAGGRYFVAVVRRQARPNPVTGLVAWQVTSRPAVAVLFSILADLVAALPTLRNAYRRPFDECAPPCLMSALAMGITLLTVNRWGFGQVALPIHILLINAALYLTIRVFRSTMDGRAAWLPAGADGGIARSAV